MAAESSYVKTNTMGTLVISDGGAVTLTMLYDRGDVSVGPIQHKLNEHVKIERRGKFVSNAYGARIYPSFSFSCYVGNIVGSSGVAPGTPTEMLTALGAYAANTNVAGTGRPTTVNLTLTMEGTNFGDTADETLRGNNVFCSIQFAEAVDGNTLTITGEVLTSVVATNSANVVTFSQIT
jgi:hypothetical protein